nr:DEAD/DEAH box helicase [Rhizomicrobium palustre]
MIEATNPVSSTNPSEPTQISSSPAVEAAAEQVAAPAVEAPVAAAEAPTPSPLPEPTDNNSVAEEPVVPATIEAAPEAPAEEAESGFDKLGLSPQLLQAVQEAGYKTPTPIQAEGIPHVLKGRDIIGIAQTGTGKTASFTLPMIEILARGRAKARMPRSLILEPTRELAAQVAESFGKYGKYNKLSMALLIGGVSFDDQEKKLDRGVDVLIATPGRLMDHFERGKLMLTQVQTLVIDEADRMLDMGFIPDVEKICKLLPFTRQTLFYSATMPTEIRRLTEQFLSNPVRVEVARPATAATNIKQELVEVPNDDWAKREALRILIREAGEITNAIVFCNKKHTVDIVAKSLSKHGFNAAPLHGDLDQSVRTKTLDGFRSGEVTILVASDVAARGLDIPAVSHVFNFDVPYHSDDYVHRIGRTGRAGRSGEAYMLVTGADSKNVDAIEKLTKNTIVRRKLEGLAEQVRERPAREKSRDGRGDRRGDRRGRRDRNDRHEHPIKPHGQVAAMEPVKKPDAPNSNFVRPQQQQAKPQPPKPQQQVKAPATPVPAPQPKAATPGRPQEPFTRRAMPGMPYMQRRPQAPQNPRVESRPVDISQLPAFLLRPVKLPKPEPEQEPAPKPARQPAKPQNVEKPAPVEAVEKPVTAPVIEAPVVAVDKPIPAPVVEAPAPVEVVENPVQAELIETPKAAEAAEAPAKAETVTEKPKRTRAPRAAKPKTDKPPRAPRKKKQPVAEATGEAPAEAVAESAPAETPEPSGEPQGE